MWLDDVGDGTPPAGCAPSAIHEHPRFRVAVDRHVRSPDPLLSWQTISILAHRRPVGGALGRSPPRVFPAAPDLPFAALPTPLTHARVRGVDLLLKRDDLIGPGMGGNKVRKLQFLTADALAAGADCLLTVGASQSNHARLTAAAGAVMGLETHLVLGGDALPEAEGNQLLSRLFGAQLHFPGTDDWDELESFQSELADQLRARGRRPYPMPIGGSTAVGALGFLAAFDELMVQCEALGIEPGLIVHATSSGGTHAGLLAGQAVYRADGRPTPRIVAVSVAKQAVDLASATRPNSATRRCAYWGCADLTVRPDDVQVDGRWQGRAYAVPTAEADAALVEAARSAAVVLDRVYTAKAFAATLALLPTTQAVTRRLSSGTPVDNQPCSPREVVRLPIKARAPR